MRFIKGQRIRWLGYVARMSEDAVAKKLINCRAAGKRTRGRQKWEEGFGENLRAKRIHGGSKRKAEDRSK